jgi:hypothetical protein
LVKKLLLASVLAIASFPSHAAERDFVAAKAEGAKTLEDHIGWCEGTYGDYHGVEPTKAETKAKAAAVNRCIAEAKAEFAEPSARITVTPPYQGPPPIGWIYGPYTSCANPPQCSMGVVNVQADGLNVRVAPNGPTVMSLVNGTPLYPLQRNGDWLLVAAACDLTPTFAWSWTAGVPLNRCWVYF